MTRIDGTAGDDFLEGGDGRDIIKGYAGNDTLQGHGGSDALDGGPGHDWASYADKGSIVRVTLAGSNDATVFVGGDAEDTVRNVESIEGGQRRDHLVGDDVRNIFKGGNGHDRLQGCGGNDTLDGEAGYDWAVYAEKTEPVHVAIFGSDDASVTVGNVVEDTIRNIENIEGGDGEDLFVGDGVSNTFKGGNGDDTLHGNGNRDTLDGGEGNDWVLYTEKTEPVQVTLAGSGRAVVTVAGVTEDEIRNIEHIKGGHNNDVLTGDEVDNVLEGGNGNDILHGNGGNDTLDGGAGSDWALYTEKTERVLVSLSGSERAWVNVGGVAEDEIRNIEHIEGGHDSDVFVGDDAGNIFKGGLGNDSFQGKGGRDTLDGEGGYDWVHYTEKTNPLRIVLAGAEETTIYVDDFMAEDTIRNIEAVNGGSGNDLIFGDILNNTFEGGGGDDTLQGHGGDDNLDGGDGVDMALYIEKTEPVHVTLSGVNSAIVTVGGVSEDTVRDIEGIEGGSGNDTLIGDDRDNALQGGEGDDTLRGEGGNDLLRGHEGDDTLQGSDDNDTLQGHAGNDTLDGGDGSDMALYTEETESLRVILAGSENSSVYVGGVVEDTIRNVENITGGGGNDVLIGDGRNNILNGWLGQDVLSGEGGADHFFYGSFLHGGDTLQDFNSGEGDKIDLSTLLQVQSQLTFNGTTAAPHAVWYEAAGSEGSIVVKADTNGDGTTEEFFITLTGVTSLAGGDFIL